MIDWLDFTVRFEHKAIEQGAFMMIEHDGTITREKAISRRVEGSYSSSYSVSSVCTPFSDVRSFSAGGDVILSRADLDNVNLPDAGLSTHLKFSGNPAKFLQGHNVFGSEDLVTLASGVVETVLSALDFNPFQLREVLKLVRAGAFQVTRIDITRSFDLQTDKAVEDYLYMLPLLARVRGNRIEAINQTVYFGKHSTLYTIKIYNKYLELNSKSKKHHLPPELLNSGIFDYARGKLRVELTLRKKELDRFNFTDALILQQHLNQLFSEHIGRIEMTNQRINRNKVFTLPKHLQATFFAWEAGQNCKSQLSHDTFYRHRRALLDYGIDISKPPVPDDLRVASIAPLLRHLVPKSCPDVPRGFEQYVYHGRAA